MLREHQPATRIRSRIRTSVKNCPRGLIFIFKVDINSEIGRNLKLDFGIIIQPIIKWLAILAQESASHPSGLSIQPDATMYEGNLHPVSSTLLEL